MEKPVKIPSLLLDEEEEQEEETVAISTEKGETLDQQLDQFREKWRQEIKRERKRSESGENVEPSEDVEEQARQCFYMGSKLEEEGALCEAVEFYKMALQLVPDIESKLAFYPQRSPRERMESESSVEENLELDEDEMDLTQRFQNLQLHDKALCKPAFIQRTCHISSLPVEVLNYIFKWVVSQQLDMKSLENLSEVCRGFYLCARDDKLWHLACLRVWGVNTGKVKKYGTWRNMFIERPHLQFVGCYISKMSYMRQGEKSLDSFYRPWHQVEYFRYIRFFADGVILMMTSPEEPQVTLQMLRNHHSKVPGMLHGYYRILGDKVTGVLKRTKTPDTSTFVKYRRNKNQVKESNESKQTFHVEFTLSNVGKRNGCKLIWNRYSIRTFYKHTGEEFFDDFELKNTTYPPLVFSRVKSYSSTAEEPLQ